MFRFGIIFLASVYSLLLKICGLIYNFVYRSKSCGVEENGSNSSANRSQNRTESGLIAKCQVICGKNVSGFLEEAQTVNFVVQEMVVGSDDVVLGNDHNLGSEKSIKEFGVESDSCSFHFDLLNGFCSTNHDSQEQDSRVENIDQEREEDDHLKIVQETEDDDRFNIDQEREEDDHFNIDRERVEDNHFKIDQEREEGDHFKIDQERKEDDNFKIDQEREEDYFKIDQEREEDYFKIDQEREEDYFKIDQERKEDHFRIDQERKEDDHFKIDPERKEDEHFKIDQEREDDDHHFNPLFSENILERRENLNLNFCVDEIPEEQDFSYEVELLPTINSPAVTDSGNWMSDFLDQEKQQELDFDHNLSEKVEDLDDEYIELESVSLKPTHIDKETALCDDSNKAEKSQEQNLMQTTTFQLQRSCWDTESDEDEADVLSEHQNLVQQMKMELKACKIKGLPTISEDCESPKVMLEDLKPLDIDHKIEYKDIMEEIQKFHKIFSEKMRKLDILSYQTLHAISFLHLKDSQVFTAGKKKVNLVSSVLPKIWQRKVQRIYADPMHKSINEMHRDLELVYVGQLCLSWEILSWSYVKARQLLDYDCDGKHSYSRSAEEFQQFQVLLQRFMEDEPFQQHRNRSYVRSLLQVPIIRDDCLKMKKERGENSNGVSLEMLVEIIRESMLIFREFLFADKKSTNVATKIDLQDLGNSELLSDIISSLQKKERRTRDNIRSRKCIVKKLKGQQECRLDGEMLRCEVELRLVVRVVNMSRLTGDQLVWCSKKLDNISFVGRKVHIDPSFLLFPC